MWSMRIRLKMRSFVLLAGLLLTPLLIAGCVGPRPYYSRTEVSTVAGSNVYVRHEPSREATAYPRLAQEGDQVEILGRRGDWVHVVHESLGEGYIFHSYVAATRPRSSDSRRVAGKSERRRTKLKRSSHPKRAPASDCGVVGPVGSRTFKKGPWTIRERGRTGTAERNGRKFNLWTATDGHVLSIVGDVVSIWTATEYNDGFKMHTEFSAISLTTQKPVRLTEIVSRQTLLDSLAKTPYGACVPAGWNNHLCATHGNDVDASFAFDRSASGNRVVVRIGLDGPNEASDGQLMGGLVELPVPARWQKLVHEAERCGHLASQAKTEQPVLNFEGLPRHY